MIRYGRNSAEIRHFNKGNTAKRKIHAIREEILSPKHKAGIQARQGKMESSRERVCKLRTIANNKTGRAERRSKLAGSPGSTECTAPEDMLPKNLPLSVGTGNWFVVFS